MIWVFSRIMIRVLESVLMGIIILLGFRFLFRLSVFSISVFDAVALVAIAVYIAATYLIIAFLETLVKFPHSPSS